MNIVKSGHRSQLQDSEEWEWRSGDQYDTFDEGPYEVNTDTNWYASPFDDTFTNTTRWHDMMHESNPYMKKMQKKKKKLYH